MAGATGSAELGTVGVGCTGSGVFVAAGGGVAVGFSVGVLVGRGVFVAVGAVVDVGVAVAVDVLVAGRVGVSVAVPVATGVAVAAGVYVAVGAAVAVWVGSGVAAAATARLGGVAGSGVAVAMGVAVAVGSGVVVFVAAGVAVDVLVDVGSGVGVGESVGTGVGDISAFAVESSPFCAPTVAEAVAGDCARLPMRAKLSSQSDRRAIAMDATATRPTSARSSKSGGLTCALRRCWSTGMDFCGVCVKDLRRSNTVGNVSVSNSAACISWTPW